MSFLAKSLLDWICLLVEHQFPPDSEYVRDWSGGPKYAARDVACQRCGKMFGRHERTR